MFKGANFVHNHIFNKHMNLITESVDKQFFEKMKYENFLKDKNKILEKYKVIHSMEEYIQYINTIKNLEISQSTLGQSSHHHHSQRNYSGGSRDYKRRNDRREFKDLDDPEVSVTTGGGGRSLI